MIGPSLRLGGMRQSFIREMTRLAITHQAINLSQGFPDFDPPREVIDAAQTRSKVVAAFQFLKNKRIEPVRKKHGNIPL